MQSHRLCTAADGDWENGRAIALTPVETGISLTGEAPCPSG